MNFITTIPDVVNLPTRGSQFQSFVGRRVVGTLGDRFPFQRCEVKQMHESFPPNKGTALYTAVLQVICRSFSAPSLQPS